MPRRDIQRLIRMIAKEETNRTLGAITVIGLNDTDIRTINKQFLRHDRATDTISFDLSETSRGPVTGEIYIGLDTAARNARLFGVTQTNEVLRLAAHGFLHILGHDDATPKQRRAMISRGDRYLKKMT